MKVVVIGAGIVGVTAALTLAERNVEVVVLERGVVVGEASGLNAGIIGGGGWGDRPDVDVALKMGSRDRFIDLATERGHEIGLDSTGTLTLIRTEEEWDWASSTVEVDRRSGRCLELVTATELVGMEPVADPELLGAILDPLGARAEPVAAGRAFAAEALTAGAIIESGCEVTDLRASTGGGWQVVVQRDGHRAEVFGADVVIIAAGPWCAEVGLMVGVDVPIVPVRGQMWASEPQPLMLRHAIAGAQSSLAWAASGADELTPPYLTHQFDRRVTRHVYGRQRANGQIVFGGDRVLTADRSIDHAGIEINHGHVRELLPKLGELPMTRTWSGLMPFSLDGRPLLGPIPERDGLFIAGGLASGGFGRGPMTGELIADLVMGREPAVDISPVLLAGRVHDAQ